MHVGFCIYVNVIAFLFLPAGSIVGLCIKRKSLDIEYKHGC